VEGGSATDAFWEPNGMYGECIRFESSEKEYCVAIPSDMFGDHITNQIAICVWVNWDDPATMPDQTNQLFSMHGGVGADYNNILGIETNWKDDGVTFWDANNSIEYGVDDEDWSGGWNHYVFVKDVNVTPGKLKIYHNGQLVEDGNSNAAMIFPADNAWIGMATDEPNDAHDNYEGEWHDQYTGLLDDFRIYDYVLSDAEIGYLATSGTGIVALQSAANLVNDEPLGERAINLRDFDKLADAWLEQILWPE
ncbi:MAG: LamG-like jellyroll fold domain-containing protein, partial [Planctomycetota bacterium]